MPPRAKHPLSALPALIVLGLTAIAIAQWQVNNQVGQVNRRVGGELYGNNTNTGSIRYATQMQRSYLPSETRYANWRSGALPSDIAMGRASVGPLAPHGAISYIPHQSPVQAAMKMPAPPLYNRAYDVSQRPLGDQLTPQPGYAASAMGGSVRYANLPPASPARIAPPTVSSGQAIPPPQLSTGQLSTGQLSSGPLSGGLLTPVSTSAALQYGSVRYGAVPQTPP